ncbi:hypothetical protein KP509_39G027100 [Ceratopteris richardii]|uniref:Polygalacturonase n=1 Tax=Ceratopteris richardii TaxID=49495 RepID=A0A8T2Q0B4_CERRI|nr:hypothetical protein KP509_39G027100 [Ceratopteris richardii]
MRTDESLPFLLLLAFLSLALRYVAAHVVFDFGALSVAESCISDSSLPHRAHVKSILDFGAIGNGATLNTHAFHDALHSLASLHASQGGGTQLIIPPGRWLTGSFNLTSHFTLYLQKGAVLIASQNIQDWPLIDPLPSYGRGRERPGGRYISFIHGQGLIDVVITGERGIIDGQGAFWWESWYKRTLTHTRPHLVEFVSSQKIIITNVVLQNSPFWTVHPVYCNDVIVKGVSIFAPQTAPNTDGIDPDSCMNVCIEDCYISNGDDLIALKSGWDEYGIAVRRPSAGIIVRRLTGTTPFSGISIGSEMSGGIKNVLVKDVNIFSSGTGIRIKSAPGRGGYIENVTFASITMKKLSKAIDITMDAGEHPDGNFDPTALPTVRRLSFDRIVGQDIASAGRFLGLKQSPLQGVCMSRISLNLPRPVSWSCSYVEGEAFLVDPIVCPSIKSSSNLDCRIRNQLS